jgi:glycosyltransferase involved in cell wall biosynthesis
LRIIFGGNALLAPLTGIGQYAFHLGTGLQNEPGFELDFLYGTRVSPQMIQAAPAAVGKLRVMVRKVVPHAYALRRALQQRSFDSAVASKGYDLYHEPNYMALRFDGPTVITVHDLSWIRYPQTHPPERVRAMDRYFEPALRRATLLLTDSEFVKSELVDVFGVAAQRILAIPLGLDPIFKPLGPSQTQPVLQRLELAHGGYFLSVGTLEPRKNLQATVNAYARLPTAVRERHPLVLAGMKGWRTTAIERVLQPLVDSGQVRMLGYLTREDLAVVTAGALAMVYPSIYEGFGLPPLEAMGCGVPPISSNVSSLPEVVGDAGLQVDPADVDAVAGAMLALASDEALRAALSRRSLARAASYTWERCVAQTAAAYRLAASTSR